MVSRRPHEHEETHQTPKGQVSMQLGPLQDTIGNVNLSHVPQLVYNNATTRLRRFRRQLLPVSASYTEQGM